MTTPPRKRPAAGTSSAKKVTPAKKAAKKPVTKATKKATPAKQTPVQKAPATRISSVTAVPERQAGPAPAAEPLWLQPRTVAGLIGLLIIIAAIASRRSGETATRGREDRALT